MIRVGSKVDYQNQVYTVEGIEPGNPRVLILSPRGERTQAKISVTEAMVLEITNEGATESDFNRLNG